MDRRPTKPNGRPPVRNPFADDARKKPKPKAEPKPTAADMAAIERANRAQDMEARERRLLTDKKPMAKGGKIMQHATKAGKAMKKKSADTMGRAMKKYAKGGSVDGCATKGKTKGKMVRMARGGMTGGCK